MSVRWWILVVWALAAGSALFWGMKVFVKAPPLPPHTQTAAPALAARGDLSRLLGVDAPPSAATASPEAAPDARFQLIGVVSPRSPQAAREGLALIAVDGKPAKAFRVGAVVDGQNILQTVAARGATLGPRGGAALVALDLPPPTPAATGQLPPSGGFVLPPPAGPLRPNLARPSIPQPALGPTSRRAGQPGPDNSPPPQLAPSQIPADPPTR